MSKNIINKTLIAAVTTCLLVVSTGALAKISAKVNLASDYTFNGVSQTDNGPALQASLDYAVDSGFYIGTWASNVDFDAIGTNIEWDGYVGQYFQLNKKTGLDAGIAYYTYHGDSASDSYNYPEVYAKFNYSSSIGKSELNFLYSWDYFGLDVSHYIVMVAHTVKVAPGHNIKLSLDRSTSTNKKKWPWDGKSAYNHYRVGYMTSWKSLDFDLAFENTTMDIDTADARVVLAVSHKFNF